MRTFALSTIALLPLSLLGALGIGSAGCSGAIEQSDKKEPTGTAHQELYLAGPKWSTSAVRVCWQGDFNTDQGTGTLVDQAKTTGKKDAAHLRADVRRYLKTGWHQYANLNFFDFDQCSGQWAEHAIVLDWNSVAYSGRSVTYGLGDPGDNGSRQIELNPYSSDLKYRVLHEFGHALGFAHEQDRPDNFDSQGNPINCANGTNETYGGTYLTPYDANSIMNYCGPSTLSPLDIQGIGTEYGVRGLVREEMNGDAFDDVTRVGSNGTSWLQSNGDGTYGTFAADRPDLSYGHVWYTRGDFNGDHLSDLIVTTNQGSFWYIAKPGGGWTQALVKNDLTLGNVSFVPGDFNGDGKTDLIVSTSQGAFWWFASASGNVTFTTLYSRPDLPYGNTVSYVPGDFDGDGKTDVVITTTTGSYWYVSNGNGSWNQAYVRNDLKIGAVMYTPGDFDGDGVTDLVITTKLGSFWYMSLGLLFNTLVFKTDTFAARSDLKLGTVAYTPGDFNGDAMTDLVVTNATGSYWYMQDGFNGTITQTMARGDLRLGVVQYTATDFSGDGRDDLVITTPTGSYWYASANDGSSSQVAQRSDVLGTVRFF